VGLLRAQVHSPDHVMFFDADDFVSDLIAQFAAERPAADGWALRDGYVFSDADPSSLLLVNGRFDRECGTSHIVRFDLFDLPADCPATLTQEEILRHFGREYVMRFLGSHRSVEQFLTAKNALLTPLPFRGAIYHTDTGENHSIKMHPIVAALKRVTRGQPLRPVRISPELRREFSLPSV